MIDQLRTKLGERIAFYEQQCGRMEPPKSAEEAKEEYLWESIVYASPWSNLAILRALEWCLDRDLREVDVSFVFDLAVEDILNVTEEHCPTTGADPLGKQRQAEFDSWPIEDCVIVYEWMKHFSAFQFESTPSERIATVMEYWRKRVESRAGDQ